MRVREGEVKAQNQEMEGPDCSTFITLFVTSPFLSLPRMWPSTLCVPLANS